MARVTRGDGIHAHPAGLVDDHPQDAAVELEVVEVEPAAGDDRLDERADAVDGAHVGLTSCRVMVGGWVS